VFLGADGIDHKGWVYTEPPDTTHMLLKMAASADRVYVAADSSKFGKRGLRRFGQLAQWAGLITDDRGDPEFVEALRGQGINVLVGQVR